MSIADDILQATLAYWDFDAGDPSTTLVDRSGNADLPFVGNAPQSFALVDGLHGQAGSWEDTSSGFANESAGGHFDMRNRPFLISLWYEGHPDVSHGGWVNIYDPSSSFDQVRLNAVSNNISFVLQRESFNASFTQPIKTTEGWHHVVVGNEPGVRRVLYHDGVLEASSETGTTNLVDRVGAVDLSGGQSSFHASEALDEILVAELAPTAEIVEWLYNDGAGRSWVDIEGVPDEEEIFRASFEDVSGRDPLPTALLERTPARQLANHYIDIYRYPPYLVTKVLPIELEDYDLSEPGRMMWHQDARDPLFAMGRWAQIEGWEIGDNPLEAEFELRISDHPESFILPE